MQNDPESRQGDSIQDGTPLASEKAEESTYPEGGVRAWSVAAGCGGMLFCTFGYVNAFG